jgi:hypothetical protein
MAKKTKRRWKPGRSYTIDTFDGLRTANINENSKVSRRDTEFSKFDMDFIYERSKDTKGYRCVGINNRVSKANGDRNLMLNMHKREMKGR